MEDSGAGGKKKRSLDLVLGTSGVARERPGAAIATKASTRCWGTNYHAALVHARLRKISPRS